MEDERLTALGRGGGRAPAGASESWHGGGRSLAGASESGGGRAVCAGGGWGMTGGLAETGTRWPGRGVRVEAGAQHAGERRPGHGGRAVHADRGWGVRVSARRVGGWAVSIGLSDPSEIGGVSRGRTTAWG
jgi:hypothetical protein